MKLGIIGLTGAGRATVFAALTGVAPAATGKDVSQIGTIRVPDERVDVLSRMYSPRKTIYAQVEYFLPGGKEPGKDGKPASNVWVAVRDADALIHVVRNFTLPGGDEPDPFAEFMAVEQDLILTDLMVVEKRLERLELDHRRGKKMDPAEHDLLSRCRRHLEDEKPLRRFPEMASAPQLRGFAFVSAKPMLVLFNNDDEDISLPDLKGADFEEECLAIRGKLEQELAQMAPEEADAFLAEFAIAAPARDRVIRSSYGLLGLVSFFTVGEDEVRAWTVRRHTAAVDAAEVIHSDIKKGFIRAEVVSYQDLMAAGSYAEARKQGTVRLEGKQYEIQDGDIVHFRFNV